MLRERERARTFVNRQKASFNHEYQASTNRSAFCKPKTNLRDTKSTEDSEFLNRRKQSSGNDHRTCIRQAIQNELSNINLQKRQFQKEGLKMEDFSIVRLVGKGKYGKVYIVIHKKTGFLCALKAILKADVRNDEKSMLQLTRQLKIHSYLTHPNIIDLYAFFDDRQYVYLLMELGSDGNLFDLIREKKRDRQRQQIKNSCYVSELQLPSSEPAESPYQMGDRTKTQNRKNCFFHEETVSFVMKDVLDALSYIHQQGIIHRDLKPENIILTYGVSKITDFGLAVNRIPQQSEMRNTICGTPIYLPPEILSGVPYDEKVDIWVVGSLAYQLFTGEDPFGIKKIQDLELIVKAKFMMNKGSAQLREFVQTALVKNPFHRLSAAGLRKLKFIKKFEQLQTSQQLCGSKPKRKHKRSWTTKIQHY